MKQFVTKCVMLIKDRTQSIQYHIESVCVFLIILINNVFIPEMVITESILLLKSIMFVVRMSLVERSVISGSINVDTQKILRFYFFIEKIMNYIK